MAERIRTRFLVVGSGVAGLHTARRASTEGDVMVLTKRSLFDSATAYAQGGIAAALGAGDSPELHWKDTLAAGAALCDSKAVEVLVEEGPARVRELHTAGADFDLEPGGAFKLGREAAHSRRRIVHAHGDQTGAEVARTLIARVRETKNIQVLERTRVLDLIVSNGVCRGIKATRAGVPIEIISDATVLATGGCGQVYSYTTNPQVATGDGYAIAHRAGVKLADMEFVQFHPTGMVWPPSVRGILVTEGVRGEGGVLRNKDGRRFMFDDIPDNYKNQTADNEEEGWRYTQGDKNARRPPELLTRDHVARCIRREVAEGRGSPHGGVFLDISWIKERLPNAREHIIRKLPSMYHQFKQLADIDITTTPMEVGPTTHYVMGGIRVDAETGQTTVPGLFAAGEVAGGMHGANRLGGNSLSDLLVFGARTGRAAADQAAAMTDEPYLDPVQVQVAVTTLAAPLERTEGEDPYAIQRDLQEMMQRLVGIFREESDLAEALDRLAELRTRWCAVRATGGRAYNPGWNLVFELDHLLTISEAITRSARLRTESRGAHSRLDFPATDDAKWGKFNIAVGRATDGTMTARTTPLPLLTDELRSLLRSGDH